LKPPLKLRQRATLYSQIDCPKKQRAGIAPAHGPPLWEATDAEHIPAGHPLLQPAPAFEFDQRLSW